MWNRFARYLRIGIQLALIAPAIWGLGLGMKSPISLILGIAAYGILCWSAVLVHELGHAAAARLTHRPVRVISVFPLEYHVASKKLRWSTWRPSGDIGGFVILDSDHWPTFGQEMLVIIGGITANLLSGLVALLLANMPVLPALLVPPLTAFALISLGLALGNTVPVQDPKGIHSDGALLIEPLRTRRRWRRWV